MIQPASDTDPSTLSGRRAPVVLAATQHDPDGRLYDQTERVLPALMGLFAGLAIQATSATQERMVALLCGAGALVERDAPGRAEELKYLGRSRRAALALALQLDAPAILFCDLDRALHWAERYPQELARVAAGLAGYDFTVLGRTTRAFESHPQVQRDTEAIINRVYATTSGQPWDVTAAARGLSRSTAAAILGGCPDESIGTDVSWPLFLQRAGGFTFNYVATEGLEFETADRFGDQVAAAGGLEQWIAQIDADPRQWAIRLELARVEVEALLPYVDKMTT
jgi:hypothetical protein